MLLQVATVKALARATELTYHLHAQPDSSASPARPQAMGLSLEHLLFLSMAFVIHLFVNSDPGTIQRACPQLGGTLTSLFCATETVCQPDSPRSPGLPLCVVWRCATEQSVGGAIIPRSLWCQNPNTLVFLLGIIVAWDLTLEPWGGEDSRERPTESG